MLLYPISWAGCWPRRRGGVGIGDHAEDDLGDLAARGVIAGPEGAVAVAAHHAPRGHRLDKGVESAARGHVAESRRGRVERGPAGGPDDDLGKLAARHLVAGPEVGPAVCV